MSRWSKWLRRLCVQPEIWGSNLSLNINFSRNIGHLYEHRYICMYINFNMNILLVFDARLVAVMLQWFFHFGEDIIIVRTITGWGRWIFQNLPLPAAQEVHDSNSGVIPCIAMKNDGVLYHQVSSFYPESMPLRSLRQSEITRYSTRWTYPCYGAVNTEYPQRWTRWWCTTPSKHLAKGDK